MAGLLGLLAVGWLLFAQVTGASIVVLKTGSMSPEIPQGWGTLAFPADAADLEVGDVVTVRLDDSSPLVTHRIVRIDSVDGRPEARDLVLQGDANDAIDLFPYRVDTALRTSTILPHAGPVLATMQSPIVLGGVIVLVGLLVLWAFWPASLEDIEAELAEREEETAR